jgi:hypothetical protein
MAKEYLHIVGFYLFYYEVPYLMESKMAAPAGEHLVPQVRVTEAGLPLVPRALVTQTGSQALGALAEVLQLRVALVEVLLAGGVRAVLGSAQGLGGLGHQIGQLVLIQDL